jgi:hypothetical protein
MLLLLLAVVVVVVVVVVVMECIYDICGKARRKETTREIKT